MPGIAQLLPTILGGTSLGLGEIGNLTASHDAAQQQKNLQNQENAVTSLTPAQLSAKAVSAEQPISNALIQTLNNSVQGDVASRGLAQAPGIFASEESQAIAPYAQQNYQTALQQVMQQLGLPIQYAQAIAQFLPKQQNMTPAMMLMMQQLAKLKSTNAGNDMSTANAPSDETLMNAFLGGGGTHTQGPISPNPNGIDPSLLNGLLNTPPEVPQ